MALNKKQTIGLIIGGIAVLGTLIYIFTRQSKTIKSRKECENKGGTYNPKTKSCKLPPAPFQEVVAKVYNNLNFVTNSATITNSSYKFLDEMADYLKNNPNLSIKITGHTDDVGSEAYNLDLSLMRANAVKKYLNEKGVGEIMITTDGKGESEPIADNKTAEGRSKNRRVVFEVTKVNDLDT